MVFLWTLAQLKLTNIEITRIPPLKVVRLFMPFRPRAGLKEVLKYGTGFGGSPRLGEEG
jgi:hypothetical protein